ncbi:hypothetical protein [Desulfosoma caldarium]|uniref:Uncharacterized protein n=1 Tax=Desulfosoma caldarium TaxID=610254 RepID=A0A3N1UFM6_9BACT|nr:hypothetical protein [Desulfosoma caldarium]ROQ90155.1 hypothetical protein EDC27_2769 [Desulfosoma caldarium]
MTFAQKMADKNVGELVLQGGDALGALFPWFQSGLWVLVEPKTTVADLLTHQWDLDLETVEKHVGTIFLNGIPVDDVGSTFLSDGDVLALSGPMPGLAGAILRKNSPLAGLRHGQKPRMDAASVDEAAPVRLRVKLFNRLIGELGPMLLQKGILLERDQAVQCLKDWKVLEKKKPERSWLDGKEVSFMSLDFHRLSAWDFVAFRVVENEHI